MKNQMFSNYVYQYPIDNWQDKKEQIKNLLNGEFIRNKNQWFNSDRDANNAPYVDELIDIISNDLQLFLQDIKVSNVSINDAWSVKYEKGDWHPPHTHSSTGYSAVLYLEYDEGEHTPVHFVDPVPDPITDRTNYSVPDVHEGMIVIVPSNVLHFTYPNTSDKVRQIVGFDIKFN